MRVTNALHSNVSVHPQTLQQSSHTIFKTYVSGRIISGSSNKLLEHSGACTRLITYKGAKGSTTKITHTTVTAPRRRQQHQQQQQLLPLYSSSASTATPTVKSCLVTSLTSNSTTISTACAVTPSTTTTSTTTMTTRYDNYGPSPPKQLQNKAPP